ncbi:MAG: hypothetical protein JXJ20_00290 [Anaerolineae bacterium]|nr:hypothetical protein [Anaerolineae bacterium]
MATQHTISRRYGVLCALIVILAGSLAPGWLAVAQGPIHDVDGLDTARFGVVEAYYRPDDARDLGVGWDRIIFEWAQFQPHGSNEFDTSAVDEQWLVDAQHAGREVVGLLKNTPMWASDIKMLGAPPNGLDLPIDDPGNVWAAFVKRAVRYYSQNWDIHHWIIYNEPDIRPGEMGWYEFDGEVEDYFKMLRVAYLAAKSVDPDAVIHIAGMAWWVDVEAGREPYLYRLLRTAMSDPDVHRNNFYFDVVMVHTYFGTQNTWDVLSAVKGILAQFGLHEKLIWIDETNASPTLDPQTRMNNPHYEITLDQQSAYIVQAAALSLAAGVERFAVYRLYDDHYVPGSETWGLVRADGSRRPAFDAYRTVINTFSSTVDARRYYSTRSALVTLSQPGRTVYVMWARWTDPVQFHVWAPRPDEIATKVSLSGSASEAVPDVVPGVSDWWYVLRAPGAKPDGDGAVMVEGTPVILVASGPPRPVWITVGGVDWRLR